MIYFVRHGLSEANVKKVFAGQKDDSLLTEKGREQAKETGKEIITRKLLIERIVSSPSKRALETAEIIAREINFDISKIIIDDRITEYDMGSLSGTPYNVISSSILVTAEGTENPQVFCNRICSCIKELDKLHGNTLVVSHGGVGRMLETIKEGRNVELFYDTAILPNASITEVNWIK
ncbi:MAG: histidine phosphatase family protein [Parcubacteria group bacterium]|nr:histidine phosphatase family protein [Parcubacteria group bacterium]